MTPGARQERERHGVSERDKEGCSMCKPFCCGGNKRLSFKCVMRWSRQLTESGSPGRQRKPQLHGLALILWDTEQRSGCLSTKYQFLESLKSFLPVSQGSSILADSCLCNKSVWENMLQPGEVTSQPEECDLKGPVVYLLQSHLSGASTMSKVTRARTDG